MDKETEILCRLAANHLHLAQFEPLKATLLALRVRNPDLALTILQTIVSNAGRFQHVLWSRSCPSPSLLAFLSTIELLRFENPTSPWGFGSETLSLRADLLLMVQVLIDGVTQRITDGNDGLRNCLRALEGFFELGVERLSFDADSSYQIEEETIVSLRSIVLDYSDVFDALCCNIERQLMCFAEEEAPEQLDNNVFPLIQRNVQLAQLDAMGKCLEEGDERGAAHRIRFLHLGYGVDKQNYQYVIPLNNLRIALRLVFYCFFGLFLWFLHPDSSLKHCLFCFLSKECLRGYLCLRRLRRY